MKHLILFLSIFITTSFQAFGQESEVENKITVKQLDQNNFANVVILQGLNKVTAKTSEFEIKVGDSVQFGKLTIVVYKCWQAPADQNPESKILLRIYEDEDEQSKKELFYGWMFASSPSISSLEHPIYDVTALSCKFR